MSILNHESKTNFNKSISINILILAALYIGLFILSNIAGSKIVDINSLIIPATLFFFPVTFILDDVITEVYGFKVSRAVIWSALGANLLVMIGSIIIVKIKPADFWNEQKAFESVFLSSPRIFVASITAYLVGEFTNSVLLAKIKVYTKGKYLWLRSITSTAIGTILDSFIFCMIAFYGKLPFEVIVKMILIQYLFKLCYAIIAMPLIYKISNFLKKKDNIDVYDFNTNFNPFSID